MLSNLATSPLLRLFGEGPSPDDSAPGMDFAERLSLGLGALDAIRLQSALQAVRALPAGASPRPGRPPDLGEDLRRARSVLAQAIAQDPLALAKARLARAEALEAVYAVFHERHLELQRQMDLMIAPLQTHVRDGVAQRSPRLRQLAALDTALAQVLARREQALVATLPARLHQRFRQVHRAAQEQGQTGDDWLDAFAADWRRALLAELDLRLAPTAALVAALDSDEPR